MKRFRGHSTIGKNVTLYTRYLLNFHFVARFVGISGGVVGSSESGVSGTWRVY